MPDFCNVIIIKTLHFKCPCVFCCLLIYRKFLQLNTVVFSCLILPTWKPDLFKMNMGCFLRLWFLNFFFLNESTQKHGEKVSLEWLKINNALKKISMKNHPKHTYLQGESTSRQHLGMGGLELIGPPLLLTFLTRHRPHTGHKGRISFSCDDYYKMIQDQ